MFPHLTFTSPTIEKWIKIAAVRRADQLHPKIQMTALLRAVQEDVDKQFDKNQSKWQELAEYTVKKKAVAGSDPRILHESRSDRLRDAYAQAGNVSDAGILTYSYPESKPYAREHQEGTGKFKAKTKMSPSLAREMQRLDKEYQDLFDRNR
jgi:hypothetical protein